MRKSNTILVLLILILLLDHVIFGGLYFFGAGPGVFKPIAFAMLLLVILHAFISMVVTIRAEMAGFKTKARYNKENRSFWLRRVSGTAIIILAILHALMMSKNENGVARINSMPKPLRLATPLLIVAVFLHLFENVRPLLISLGIRNIDKKEKAIKIVLSIIALFAIAANIYTIVSHIGGH
jgi:succinate dehydrogenase hydrophobic anchor subunit